MSQTPYVTVWHNGRQVVQDRESTRRLRRPAPWAASVSEVICVTSAATGVLLFRLHDHLRRLLETARLMEMEVPYGTAELADACRFVARVNAVPRGLLHLGLTRDLRRREPVEATAAMFEDSDGEAEAIFFVRGRELTAAPVTAGPPGVILQTITSLAAEQGLGVCEGEGTLEGADEIFVAGAAVGILPARTVDGGWAAGGGEGPVTAALREAYEGVFVGGTADRRGWLEPVELWPAPRYAEPVA